MEGQEVNTRSKAQEVITRQYDNTRSRDLIYQNVSIKAKGQYKVKRSVKARCQYKVKRSIKGKRSVQGQQVSKNVKRSNRQEVSTRLRGQ